jgi:putative phosphoribosyl transferase
LQAPESLEASMRTSFRSREEAGRALAERLLGYANRHPVVFALPRGGVPVAARIARALQAPLDLLFVRKIGLPWQPELAYAAIVDGNPPETVINDDVARYEPLSERELSEAVQRELDEIKRRRELYLTGRAPIDAAGRAAIVVDDGLATGTTARAALLALNRRAPSTLVLAVPVAPRSTVRELSPLVDELVCLATPEPFDAIGLHYDDFHQLSDDEVIELLQATDAP